MVNQPQNWLMNLMLLEGKSTHHKNMGLYLRKPKSREEELKIELMKKEIEIARLKKGYEVKGVGPKKEFVTTFEKNTK